MDKEREKQRLEAQVEKLQALLKAFPEGPIHQNILDLIDDLRRDILQLEP